MLRAIYRLIEQLIENHAELAGLRRQLTHFQNRMEDAMANHEERLQAILTRVNAAVALIQDLRNRTDDPALSDELDAIENALAGAETPPVEDPPV